MDPCCEECNDARSKHFAMHAVLAAKADMLATKFSHGSRVALVCSRPKQLHYEKGFDHWMTAVKHKTKAGPVCSCAMGLLRDDMGSSCDRYRVCVGYGKVLMRLLSSRNRIYQSAHMCTVRSAY